jgi:hypothetical protein
MIAVQIATATVVATSATGSSPTAPGVKRREARRKVAAMIPETPAASKPCHGRSYSYWCGRGGRHPGGRG